ncbi:hypothetical protein B0H14DRAFT_2757922 [Mycena olivaceomarginata]|nr:hypothetical protein B0H14DRAFT_2757922 [Mycena olivaceomarginata]
MSVATKIPPFQPRALAFSPVDEHAIHMYHAKLMQLRAAALEAPLETGIQFSLDLDIPQQNPDPLSRQIPFIRSPTAPSGRSTVCLELSQGLQTEPNGFSQVWTAHSGATPGLTFVLKIIQPSMCHLPHPDDTWVGNYTDPWNLANREAWGYQNLAQKQGLCIPYFFGIHEITTPSKESAWVLVLEFIPGITGQDVIESMIITDIQAFCKLGVDAVTELARSGWVLSDLRAPNFILTGPRGAWTIVIIDLCDIQPVQVTKDIQKRATRTGYHFFCQFVTWVQDLGVGIQMFPWAEKNLPRGILDITVHYEI